MQRQLPDLVENCHQDCTGQHSHGGPIRGGVWPSNKAGEGGQDTGANRSAQGGRVQAGATPGIRSVPAPVNKAKKSHRGAFRKIISQVGRSEAGSPMVMFRGSGPGTCDSTRIESCKHVDLPVPHFLRGSALPTEDEIIMRAWPRKIGEHCGALARPSRVDCTEAAVIYLCGPAQMKITISQGMAPRTIPAIASRREGVPSEFAGSLTHGSSGRYLTRSQELLVAWAQTS
jgi:hypothetical protein